MILISTERSFSLAAASCYQPQCIDAHLQPSSDGHVPVELSMLLSRFLKASEKNAVEVKVCGKRRREVGLVIPGHYKARTKSRSHCKILDRELNYMKTKYSHFETEHELSEERILMPYVTSSK